LPSVNQAYREWESRGLSVLLVNIQESPRKVARVVAERGYAAPVVLDTDGAITEAYGVHATPTAFVVARDGTILARALGPRPWTGPDGQALFRALLGPVPRTP
jgi:cytochrome c biogenesis protein CcmG, thiol:disulfide interchange protein DsbE